MIKSLLVGCTLALVSVVASAQWQAIQLPTPASQWVEYEPDRFLVLSTERYEGNHFGTLFTASRALVYRVESDGTVDTVFMRSHVVNEYEPGTEAVSIEVVDGYAFVHVMDVSDVAPYPVLSRFRVDADTAWVTDSVNVGQICTVDRGHVHRWDPERMMRRLYAEYDFNSHQLVEELEQPMIDSRQGLWSIVRDSSNEAWLVRGCDEERIPLGSGEGIRAFHLRPTGHISRVPTVGGGDAMWSGDQGITWNSYPERGPMVGYDLLADGTLFGISEEASWDRKSFRYYDPVSASWQHLRDLPDSVYGVLYQGASLSAITFVAQNWPFSDGSRAPALVRADLSTSVQEDPAMTERNDAWTLFDLLGRPVRSGLDAVDYKDLPHGAFILRQGNMVRKILR